MNEKTDEKISNIIPQEAEVWGEYNGENKEFFERLITQRKNILERAKAAIAKKKKIDPAACNITNKIN
jgi:metal-dependent amidase/aminoacylase/carboxypeptidase family protein